MSALRVLGFCYLGMAAFVALAVATADQARLHDTVNWAGAADRAADDLPPVVLAIARFLQEKFFDPPRRHIVIALSPPGPNEGHISARAPVPKRQSLRLIDRVPPQIAEPLFIAPDLLQFEFGGGDEDAGPLSARYAGLPQTPARLEVQARLEQSLTPELRENFDLFLFVSKGARGDAAQRFYVFSKQEGGLFLLYDWAASTGRESYEISPIGKRAFTATPGGFYQLDPKRLYRRYRSRAWNGAMPYAMFFNWVRNGIPTGIAIHGTAGGGAAKLGRRASAGCIHVSKAHAKLLFDLIQERYRGNVPRFAYDEESSTMSNRGNLMRDAAGQLVMAEGYRVLIDVEDLSGAHRIAQID